MKATGLPCCDITAPMPSPEALVSIVNESLKLGMASVGVVVMAWLSAMNADSALSSHTNWPVLRRLMRGQARTPYYLTNFR